MIRSFRNAIVAAALVTVSAGAAHAENVLSVHTGSGGPLVDATFSGNDINTGSAQFSQTVTTAGILSSVESVTLTDFKHTFAGDLGIYLIGPDGSSYSVLVSPPNNEGSNFNGNYTFVVNPMLPTVDESIIGHTTAYDLPSGTYAVSDYGDGITAGPRSDFSALSGMSMVGIWTLEIDDYYPGDTGSLGNWSFVASTATTPEPTSIALIGLAGTLVRRRR